MLNQDKIVLMTKLASYEENDGKENVKIGKFFRADYIGWQILKSVVCATLAYIIIAAMWVIYDFEAFMINIYKTDIVEYGKEMLTQYICFVALFGVLTYVLYSYRYAKARKSLKLYYHNLKKLENME